MTLQPSIQPPPLAGRKLVFVVTEDWFFASHFLPMARAARELGLDVAVVTRVRDHREAIEATGARVIPLEAERRSLNPMAAGYAAGPARVDPCGPRRPTSSIASPCAASSSAALRPRWRASTAASIALTGLGLPRRAAGSVGRLARRAVRLLVRGLTTAKTRYLFENSDDPRFSASIRICAAR